MTAADNLALWNSVCKTDPKHTKPITGKQYKGTSPSPFYLIQRATETFGPCGIGWGFEIVSERIEEGGGEKVHFAHVRVWYEWQGKRGTVEHVGGTPFAGTRSSGKSYADEDAPKKSVTDALVKALSMIGFAGDIFIGLYDDNKYVRELREEMRDDPAAPAQFRTPTPSNPTGAGEPLAIDARPIPNAQASAETRQKLMDLMGRAQTRPGLRAWADTTKIAAAIESLTDRDGAMFAAEFKKKWEALPESLAMAG